MTNRISELRLTTAKEEASVAELELIAAELRRLFREEGSDRLREQMRTNAEALTWARARLAEHKEELGRLQSSDAPDFHLPLTEQGGG